LGFGMFCSPVFFGVYPGLITQVWGTNWRGSLINISPRIMLYFGWTSLTPPGPRSFPFCRRCNGSSRCWPIFLCAASASGVRSPGIWKVNCPTRLYTRLIYEWYAKLDKIKLDESRKLTPHGNGKIKILIL
jgi:hypothetical protein